MKVCWESVSLSAGQSLGMNRITLMWLLIHKTVVFAFYWLHFLYGHILKYLDGSFYIKYNLSSKLFILLIIETTFCIQEVLLLPFHTWETDIWNISTYYFIKMSKVCPSKHVWLESRSMMWKYQLVTQLWYHVTVHNYSNECRAHMAIIFLATELAALLQSLYAP